MAFVSKQVYDHHIIEITAGVQTSRTDFENRTYTLERLGKYTQKRGFFIEKRGFFIEKR